MDGRSWGRLGRLRLYGGQGDSLPSRPSFVESFAGGHRRASPTAAVAGPIGEVVPGINEFLRFLNQRLLSARYVFWCSSHAARCLARFRFGAVLARSLETTRQR